jgi:hypothetical protein
LLDLFDGGVAAGSGREGFKLVACFLDKLAGCVDDGIELAGEGWVLGKGNTLGLVVLEFD